MILLKRTPIVWALSLLMSLFIALAVVKNSSLTIAGVMAVIFVMIAISKPKMVFYISITGLLAVPYGTYDFFNLVLPYVKVDIFNLSLYGLFCVTFATILMKRSAFPRIGWMYVLWLVVVFVYIMVGRMNHNLYLTSDIKTFSLFIIYFLSAFFFEKVPEPSSKFAIFIKIATVSGFVLSIIIFLMYFYKFTYFNALFQDSFYTNDTRVGSGNQSIFILSIPLMLTALRLKILSRRWNFLIVVSVILMIASIIISESRFLIFATAINTCIAYVIISFVIDNRGGFGVKYLKFFGMLSVVGGLIFVMLAFTDIGSSSKLRSLSERFAELFVVGKQGSYSVREVTNMQAIFEIKQRMNGYGLGSTMKLLDPNGVVARIGTFIDNGFLTIMYKFGIGGLIVYCLFYLVRIKDIFHAFRRNDGPGGKFALITLVSLPLFIVNCMVFTSQLAMNSAVFGFTLCLLSLFIKHKKQEAA